MAREATNTTITFRLSPELHDEIVRRAEAGGISKHEVARKLVVGSLIGSDKADDAVELDVDGVQDAFESLHDCVMDLRTALGRGIGAVLQDLSPHRSKDEIRKWVFDRIIAPSPRKQQENIEGDDLP